MKMTVLTLFACGYRLNAGYSRAEGLLNVDEAKQGRFTDEPRALTGLHTRVALL